jgi:hypothetical protein
MITEIDVKRIEQEMRLALHQDGLDEILVGLTLGIMALFFIVFRFSIALIVGCIIQILVKPACRRRITYPRLGYAKLHDFRDRIPGGAILVLSIAAVIVGAGLFFVSQLRWLLPAYQGWGLAGLLIPVGIIRLNIFLRKYSGRSIEDAHGKE